jgi:hypothetical protein
MTNVYRPVALLAACAALLAACSTSTTEGQASPGSSPDAGSPQKEAGSSAPGLKCGGKQCSLPQGAGIEQVTACCTDTNECGLKHPVANKCLALGSGTANPACPSLTLASGSRLDGCCAPSGCGVLDAFVGCMPNAAVGKPEKACDATNDCTSLNALPCDGAEDCPKGQLCCGRRESQSTYTGFGCFPSCLTAPDPGPTAVWLQICHAGEVCEDKTAGVACTTSQLLPSTLARCASAGGSAPPSATPTPGEIRCGTTGLVCSPGESCCVRPPHDPYCAPAGTACACKHGDAGP